MSNLTPLSPLLQPVMWQGQDYFTSHYFHQQYVTQSPTGGKHRQHPNFVRVIRAIPAYQDYLDSADIVELTWREVIASNDVGNQNMISFKDLFQAAGWNPITLLNATGQLAMANHLEDEASRQMAVAANTTVARQATKKSTGQLLPEEHAERAMAAYLNIGAMLQTPTHIVQQEAVKQIAATTGVNLRPLLLAAPAQDGIKDDERMLEPTDLAKELGLPSGAALNKALVQLGWQIKHISGGWEVTPTGQPHSVIHAWTQGNKSGYNLKWAVQATKAALHAAGLLPPEQHEGGAS